MERGATPGAARGVRHQPRRALALGRGTGAGQASEHQVPPAQAGFVLDAERQEAGGVQAAWTGSAVPEAETGAAGVVLHERDHPSGRSGQGREVATHPLPAASRVHFAACLVPSSGDGEQRKRSLLAAGASGTCIGRKGGRVPAGPFAAVVCGGEHEVHYGDCGLHRSRADVTERVRVQAEGVPAVP